MRAALPTAREKLSHASTIDDFSRAAAELARPLQFFCVGRATSGKRWGGRNGPAAPESGCSSVGRVRPWKPGPLVRTSRPDQIMRWISVSAGRGPASKTKVSWFDSSHRCHRRNEERKMPWPTRAFLLPRWPGSCRPADTLQPGACPGLCLWAGAQARPARRDRNPPGQFLRGRGDAARRRARDGRAGGRSAVRRQGGALCPHPRRDEGHAGPADGLADRRRSGPRGAGLRARDRQWADAAQLRADHALRRGRAAVRSARGRSGWSSTGWSRRRCAR